MRTAITSLCLAICLVVCGVNSNPISPAPPAPEQSIALLGIRIASEVRKAPYDRDDYAYLQSIELSIIDRQGGIFSLYTLLCFTDRYKTDIEHIVATAEAHESGMSERTDEDRKAFGNDLDILTLASPQLNRFVKVAKDPAEWLPDENRCWYVDKYIEIKKKYGLTMDPAEADFVWRVYSNCASYTMVKGSVTDFV